jgi:ribosomal-protein-alanine N-acetyltransferase
MLFRIFRSRPSSTRLLRADRAEECAAIHASAFAHAWSVAEFAAILASAATIGSAALDPATSRLRGFAMSRLVVDEAEILTIWRGRGVGRDLLRDHLSRAALSGARTMFLEVDEDNAAAIALYVRFGFVSVGRREGYYRKADGKPASALTMRRNLV